MLEAVPWTLGVKKSHSVLLWSSPPHAMLVGFLLASHLRSSILCFFLLKREVLLILGSGSYKIGLHINRKILANTITNTTNTIKQEKKITIKDNKILSHFCKANSIVNS